MQLYHATATPSCNSNTSKCKSNRAHPVTCISSRALGLFTRSTRTMQTRSSSSTQTSNRITITTISITRTI